ncbi:MAG: vWA domain-containing protein [Bacteroidia bacterium]
MSVQFFTEYPLWFILFCLAAGGLYSFALYGRGNSLQFDSNPKLWTWIISGIRFLSVSIIAFLLLNPLLKYISSEVEKPIVVLAFDNSESIINQADSAIYRKKLSEFYKSFQKQIGDEIKVQPYLFGDRPEVADKPNFKGKQTDISALFAELSNVYSGSNVGGMVLISDGIYNKGSNPVYASKNTRVPVFTVGLGDTITKKDLKISNIRTNSIAYLNNTFPAIIDVQANKCAGEDYTLTILNGENKVFETRLSSSGTSDFKSVTLDLEASKPGVLHYTVLLSKLNNEVTWLNNRRDFFIEVIDARQKIWIAARSPHPDISAFKQAIESNKNYQVEVDITGNPSLDKADDYDLVILHQLPSSGNHVPFIEGLKAKRIPLLFVMGRQMNMAFFNSLKVGLTFSQTGGGYNQTTGIMNTDFNLFENTDAVKSNVPYFPPFSVPFGTFGFKDKNQTMVYQQIGSVKTDQPLIYFNDEENNRYGFFTGEGFWRWRLIDFDRNNNHDVSNDVVCKSVQYLVARNDKRKFRVYAIENTFYENEPVIFNAEYYNQSYELVNKPEVKMTLTNDKGKNYTYNYSRTANAYKLDAGILAPGKYSYTARVISGGNNETVKGIVIVKPLQLEYTETKANHDLLKQLASATGGKFIPFSDLDKLAEWIKKQGTVKPVMYEQKDYRDLINQKWMFFLILILMTTEWFVRKRNGAY